MNELRRRFRAWRKEHGYTLDEVLIEVNKQVPPDGRRFTRTTISNYEARNDPTVAFCVALWKAFPDKVDLDWLVLGPDLARRKWAAAGALQQLVRLGDPKSDNTARIQEEINYLIRDVVIADSSYGDVSEAGRHQRGAEKLADLRDDIAELCYAPFSKKRHFLSLTELTTSEATTYAHSFVAAVRPLLKPLRTDRPRQLPDRE